MRSRPISFKESQYNFWILTLSQICLKNAHIAQFRESSLFIWKVISLTPEGFSSTCLQAANFYKHFPGKKSSAPFNTIRRVEIEFQSGTTMPFMGGGCVVGGGAMIADFHPYYCTYTSFTINWVLFKSNTFKIRLSIFQIKMSFF